MTGNPNISSPIRSDAEAAAGGGSRAAVWPEALGAVSMILGGKLLFWGLWSQTYPL